MEFTNSLRHGYVRKECSRDGHDGNDHEWSLLLHYNMTQPVISISICMNDTLFHFIAIDIDLDMLLTSIPCNQYDNRTIIK